MRLILSGLQKGAYFMAIFVAWSFMGGSPH
jgi:hypothetical protein